MSELVNKEADIAKKVFKPALWASAYLAKLNTVENGISKELTIGFRDGYPRFNIRTLTSDDVEIGKTTSVPFTNIMMKSFSKMLQLVVGGKNKSFRVTSRNNKFTTYRTDEIEVRGIIEARMHPDYVAIHIFKDNEEHVFPITVDNIYFGVEVEGKEVTNSKDVSLILASTYADLLSNMIDNYLAIMVDRQSKTS